MTTRPADRRSRSNRNERGGTPARRARRAWLMETFRADMDLAPDWETSDVVYVKCGEGIPLVRCYRCGDLMSEKEMTIDRIIPGHKGGTYRRNNIRPACGPCNFGSTRAVGRWEDEESA
ncbi:MAG: HNH endonuclease [Nocardioidaceae bacterium]